MKRITLFFIILGLVVSQQLFGQGFDFRHFDNTPVADLARAVETQDTLAIVTLVRINKMDVNYIEPQYGNSLLELALIKEKQFSVEKLFELGADPNLRSPFDNSTPFLSFCNYARGNSLATPEMFSLLIKYKADVNSEQVLQKADTSTKTPLTKKTALQFLCISGSLETVKLLGEHGARLDVYPRNGRGCIFLDAVLNPNLDIFRYLLIEKKIPIPDYVFIRNQGTKREEKLGLRYMIYKIQEIHKRSRANDAHQQELEAEIQAFLKAHGK